MKTVSETVKNAGLESLAQLAKISTVSQRTLINWYTSKPTVFNCVLLGAVELTKKDK